jgi:signal peptidase I
MNDLRPQSPKPWIAISLSCLCTGLGQMYCGRMRRGLAFFLLSLLVSPVAALAAAAPPSREALATLTAALVAAALLYLAAVVDAGRLARRLQAAPSAEHGLGLPLYVLFVAVGLFLPLGSALYIRAHSLEAFFIPTASMSPTLLPGDRILVDKHATSRLPERGEVVVFRAPPDGRRSFVKRVIAVGGDHVELRKGEVWVNGRALPRAPAPDEGPNAWWESNGARRYRIVEEPGEQAPRDLPDLVVPEGQVFVLGDHRSASLDSTAFGTVRKDDLVGAVTYVFWPSRAWSRFGPLE